MELFAVVSFIVLAGALPVNLTGDQVDILMAQQVGTLRCAVLCCAVLCCAMPGDPGESTPSCLGRRELVFTAGRGRAGFVGAVLASALLAPFGSAPARDTAHRRPQKPPSVRAALTMLCLLCLLCPQAATNSSSSYTFSDLDKVIGVFLWSLVFVI